MKSRVVIVARQSTGGIDPFRVAFRKLLGIGHPRIRIFGTNARLKITLSATPVTIYWCLIKTTLALQYP